MCVLSSQNVLLESENGKDREQFAQGALGNLCELPELSYMGLEIPGIAARETVLGYGQGNTTGQASALSLSGGVQSIMLDLPLSLPWLGSLEME